MEYGKILVINGSNKSHIGSKTVRIDLSNFLYSFPNAQNRELFGDHLGISEGLRRLLGQIKDLEIGVNAIANTNKQ